jgi:hypothetical protein
MQSRIVEQEVLDLIDEPADKMSQTEPDFIEITDVRYLSEYKLKFSFNDGKEHVVNFEPFLKKTRHPEIIKYVDIDLFELFTFEYGHLHWNDYDLSFYMDNLYQGQVI